MEAAAIIAAVNGALALIDVLGPQIARLASKGEITVEQQAALQARIDALRRPEAFGGPEWRA